MKKPVTHKQVLPRGLTEKEIRDLIDHYDHQTEDEQVAEIEAVYEANGQTRISVPTSLVPKIEALIVRAHVNRKNSTKRGRQAKGGTVV